MLRPRSCEGRRHGAEKPRTWLEAERTSAASRLALRAFLLLVVVLIASPSVLAQTDPAPAPVETSAPAVTSSPVETSAPAESLAAPGVLHAYVNLIQIPVLVLDAERRHAPVEGPANFSVRLDSGPPFAPRHVRLEGTDALRLTVLIDASGATGTSLSAIHDKVAHLGELLSGKDTVSLAVLTGCTLQSSRSMPPDPGRIRTALLREEQGVSATTAAHGELCGKTPRLWDFAMVLLDRMDETPGRRVLLLLTDGRDAASQHTWHDLVRAATLRSTTIFAIRPNDEAAYTSRAHEIDPLTDVTELTGGMVLNAPWRPQNTSIDRFNDLVRSRYILEFPRPAKMGMGTHDLIVTLRNDRHAFVRPSGAGVPLPDPKELNDPDLVPSSTVTPEVGTRRVLTH